jgi:hypothetical protein
LEKTGVFHLKITAADQVSQPKFQEPKERNFCFVAVAYFSQECKGHNVTPNCAKVKVPKTSTALNHTLKSTTIKN